MNNEVQNFHSSSTILKIEWREEPQSFNAHVQPFLSPVTGIGIGENASHDPVDGKFYTTILNGLLKNG